MNTPIDPRTKRSCGTERGIVVFVAMVLKPSMLVAEEEIEAAALSMVGGWNLGGRGKWVVGQALFSLRSRWLVLFVLLLC